MFDRVPITVKVDKVVINLGCCRRRVALGFAFGLPTQKERKPMPVEITLTTEQKVRATITPKTQSGNPAQLDGKPNVSVPSGDATIANVSDDGLSFDIVSPDAPGQSQVLVEADADLGSGVETISDIITVNIVGARAANLGLSLGTPEPK